MNEDRAIFEDSEGIFLVQMEKGKVLKKSFLRHVKGVLL